MMRQLAPIIGSTGGGVIANQSRYDAAKAVLYELIGGLLPIGGLAHWARR